MRIFLILGYIGLAYALFRKKYFEVMLILGIMCSSWTVIFSHIEYRYFIPFYSVLSFFVGYFFVELRTKIYGAS